MSEGLIHQQGIRSASHGLFGVSNVALELDDDLTQSLDIDPLSCKHSQTSFSHV